MQESRHPIVGIDYPGTFEEFDEWFSSEEACLEYVARLRWPDGFIVLTAGTAWIIRG